MRAIVIVFFLGLWQITALSGLVNPLLMPSLGAICSALGDDLFSGVLGYQLLFSVALVAAGTLLGALGGWVFTLFSELGRSAKATVDLLASLLHPLPGIALLPLIILWVGIGTPAVLLIMVHSSLWPIFLNLRSGLGELPIRYREMAKNWELSWRQNLFHIILPALFPPFLSGFRTGWARSWRALVAAEMVFGAAGYFGGIGWYIFERRVYMDTPGLYGGLLMVMAVGVAVDYLLFDTLEQFVHLRWARAGVVSHDR